VDGPELVASVERAGLDPGRLDEHPPLPDGGRVWALEVDGTGWFDTWSRLRALVPDTGRWPVATTAWGPGVDVVRRRGVDPRTGVDEAPAAVMARLGEVDVDGLLDRQERESMRLPLDEWYEEHEEETRRRCGRAPVVAELRADLGDEPVEMEIERWLLRWELEHGGLTLQPGEAPYLDWFEPRQPTWILLLPRREPWSVAAYTGSYGCEYPHPDLQPALFRRWNQRYGAEPAANWDTMQQLVVTRPPQTVEDAFALAREMDLLWSDTVMLPGVTVREHAIDLIGRRRWFLHRRP
jgi:hypothetical protein